MTDDKQETGIVGPADCREAGCMEERDECREPCPPTSACNECADYWERMRSEGLWDDSSGWTDRGWREILK